VENEIDCQQNAILYCVLGANPLFEVVKGFIGCICEAYVIYKIAMVWRGLLMVRYENL